MAAPKVLYRNFFALVLNVAFSTNVACPDFSIVRKATQERNFVGVLQDGEHQHNVDDEELSEGYLQLQQSLHELRKMVSLCE